jgi:hypothetical protein
MIVMTKEGYMGKDALHKMLLLDHVLVLDGKKAGFYPKLKVIAIHRKEKNENHHGI